MEIKSNKIDTANASIEATITMDEVNANLDKLAKELSKTATIAGFRKGKVPVSAVKKQYGEKLIEDAEGEALRAVLNDGLKEIGLDTSALIGEPNVYKFDKSDEKIEVGIKVAMRPVLEMGDYASMVDGFDAPKISNKEIDERITELAQSQAPLVDIKRNRMMKKGDTAVIDFEGFIDGVAFDGGKGEDHALVLGSNSFIPGFEDQLIGVKRDEEVTIKVTFPENYGGDLAGKDAEFKVTVKQVQVKEEVAIDDELAKKMLPGEEGADVAKLKELVKEQIENEKLGKLYQDEMKPALLEKFVNSFKFDLPEFVVEQELDMALNKKAGSMSEDEIKELRESEEKLQELRETLREEATRSVRATFIIDSLAQAENIKIEENEVMQTIYYEAMQTGQDPKAAYEQYKESGYLPAIQMSMVEDKVLSTLLNAKIKKV